MFEAVKAQIQLVEKLASMVDEVNQLPVIQTKSKGIATMLENRLSERQKLQKAVDRLYLDFSSEVISLDEYRRLKVNLTQQVATLDQAILKLEEETNRSKEGVKKDSPLFTSFLVNKNISELTRGILMAIVECVFVYEGGKDIEVRFKHGDHLSRTIEFIEENKAGLQHKENP